MLKKNINYLDINPVKGGKERQDEILREALDNGAFLPKTVLYKDIDNAFREWVDKELPIVDDSGSLFPTMTLFSNQRFSEYMQSWQYTDANNNLILDFKTVNRDNNPQFGKIQNGFYNIPGERFYSIKKKVVLDDNGSESFLNLKMKQPTAVDIIYRLTIFTTKYQYINDFNILINETFNARQSYIQPNGYYMPMVLDGINDESQYNIDDRQFYSQVYNIKVMGFLITENDFRIDEVPMKISCNYSLAKRLNPKPEVEIEDCEDDETQYYYKPMILTIKYPVCRDNVAKFVIDTDFVCTDIEKMNILKNYRIFINDNEVDKEGEIVFKENDSIKIIAKRRYIDKEGFLIINGYDPNTVYDEIRDNKEFPDNSQEVENRDFST